jgi:hypothetical protein
MLERITKYVIAETSAKWKILIAYSFMAHPETLLPMADNDDPLESVVSVIKFSLSGWHIKPP